MGSCLAQVCYITQWMGHNPLPVAAAEATHVNLESAFRGCRSSVELNIAVPPVRLKVFAL